MATSRDLCDGQPPLSPRPSRVRRIPGHLEDFELSYPHQPLYPPNMRPVSSPRPAYDESPSQGGAGYPVAAHHPDGTPAHNWQRLEARWQMISRQMQELESEMDKVKIISHTQSALAYPSYHSQQFTAYQSRYNSLPQLELCSPTNQHMEETGLFSYPQAHPAPLQTSPSTSPPQTQADPPAPQTQQTSPAASVTSAEQMQPAPLMAPRASATEMHSAPTASRMQPASPVTSPVVVQPEPPVLLIHPGVIPAPAAYPQSAPAPPEQPYNAHHRYWQTAPQPYQPMQYAAPPPVHHSYMMQPHAPAWPTANPNIPSMMEMEIALSYGIPKPRLTIFSSGK
ncbi:hypothetical protein NQZ68_019986 [Dissostichus eleginoides]|nr:hypothetical protein NQZ68_019986 [Dissostichus eleginoides]